MKNFAVKNNASLIQQEPVQSPYATLSLKKETTPVQQKQLKKLPFQTQFPLQKKLGGLQLLDKPNNIRSTSIHQTAAAGVQGAGGKLPHLNTIQKSFGRFDVTHVQAYSSPAANAATKAMGAEAYATGAKIAFNKSTPSLHTAAHEAAHVIQQRAGVQLKEGVGSANDVYEKHADAVADRVVQGKSAEGLLSNGPLNGLAVQPMQRNQNWPLLQQTAVLSQRQSNGHISQENPPVQMRTNQNFLGRVELFKTEKTLVDTPYVRHTLTVPAGKNGTKCATTPSITTAGEQYNNEESDPGDPDEFSEFQKLAKLLVSDKNDRTKASTQMHAINHHLDAKKGAGGTQQNPNNIFLGTSRSNTSIHKTKVEVPIKESLRQDNKTQVLNYQAAMAAATSAKEEITNKDVLFWENGLPRKNAFENDAVEKTLTKPALLHDNPANVTLFADFAALNRAKIKGDKSGEALLVEHAEKPHQKNHAWLTYAVEPVYPNKWDDVPGHVSNNYQAVENQKNRHLAAAEKKLAEQQDELAAARKAVISRPATGSGVLTGGKGNKTRGGIKASNYNKEVAKAQTKVTLTEGKIKKFEDELNKLEEFKTWAPNAFALRFKCEASYYTPSYNKAKKYYESKENFDDYDAQA